ncbi:MAG: SIMPL domain-containing protein [Candidatus Hydrothermarchaeales archaeon]
MNKRRLLLTTLLILFLIWTAGCLGSDGQGLSDDIKVSAPTDAAGRGIVVTGEGEIRVTPDQAVLTVGVVTTSGSSQEAMAENSAAMNQVISAVKRAGVSEKDVQTQSVNVWPQFDYGRVGEKRELPEIIGYRAENRAIVTIRDVATTGEVIDAAVEAGANQLYGLSFTVSEETGKALRTEVLQMAVSDAEEKAQAIADALGADRITPVSVVEGAGYTPPIYRYDVAALEKGAAAVPISPGETEVSASVTVTFDFE